MRKLLTTILVFVSLSVYSQVDVYQTQWKNDAQFDIQYVDRAHNADVIICCHCKPKNIRWVSHKMNADVIVRVVNNSSKAVKVYMPKGKIFTETKKQKRNFKIYFGG